MAIGITVSGDALLGYTVTITDADQGDRIRVYRTDLSGHYPDLAVRTLDLVEPSGDTMVVVDHEAPFNTDLQYIAEAYDLSDLDNPVGTDTSDVINTVLEAGFVLITDALDPTRRVQAGVTDLSEWTNDGIILGDHKILGRTHRVLAMDIEDGRKGTMVLDNLNCFSVDYDETGPYELYEIVNHEGWESVFGRGRTLLFRNSWEDTGFDDLYFKTIGRGQRRIGIVGIGTPHKEYTIQYVEQDRPLTSIVGLGLTTWQTVLDSNFDWQEVLDDHADWLSVLTDPGL